MRNAELLLFRIPHSLRVTPLSAFDTKTVVFASKAERGEAAEGRGGELTYKNDELCWEVSDIIFIFTYL